MLHQRMLLICSTNIAR